MSSPDGPFRVIIVGAGPVALVAALALAKAGIDFVVLERRDALDLDAGASMAMWPHNVRLLDQLGLLEIAHKTYMPVKHKRNLRRDGTELCRNTMFERARENHGHPWMCFRRAKLVNMLYEGLPDKSKLLFGKEVASFEETDTGVTVRCADGTSYTGSMLLGADGVRSSVRRHIDPSQNHPFTSNYRGMYGYCERLPELEPETCYETHGKDFTIQVIVGEEWQQFLLYEKLPEPSSELVHYTEEDREAYAQKYADVRFPGQKPGEFVTMGDVWRQTQWSTLANLEEGIVNQWHKGRCVLVGDAVHRMTPNIGFGMNSGLQGVVQLVNRLYALLKKDENPDTAALDRTFAEYHAARVGNSRLTVETSGLYTRLVAWSNPVWRFTDQYILPYVNGDHISLDLLMTPIVQRGEPFNFLRENSFKQGKYRYHTGPVEVK